MTILRNAALALCSLLLLSLQVHAAPALWRLADEDTTIHLFGTLHIVEAGTAWTSPTIAQAFDKADMLIVEVDDAELAKAGALFAAAGRLPDTTNLRLVVGNGIYGDVDRLARSLGLPKDAFLQARPWFAAMSLSVGSLVRAGFDPSSGVDKALLNAARAQNKEVASLESAAFQVELFGGLGADAEKALLVETLKEAPDVKAMFTDMQATWLSGDAEKLGDLMNKSMVAHPDLADRLLYARNETWAKQLTDLLKTPGRFFVAVGAGHLSGERSLVAILREQGQPVSRAE